MDITSARLQYTAISEGGAKQDGSDFLGAGSSDPNPPTGDGAAMSHSTPLERRSFLCPTPSLQIGDGEHQSPPEPVGGPHSGVQGAEPPQVWPPLLTGGQKTVGGGDFGLQVAFLDPAALVPEDQDQNTHQDQGGGGEGMQLSLDWYSVTLHPTPDIPVDVSQVQLAASLALDCEPGDWVETERGAYGYQRGMVGPGGARLWWDAPGRDDFHVSFPGQACRIAGRERLVSFLRYSLGHGGKSTRCDVALDDYRRIVSPGEVQETLQGPDVVTHAQKVLTQQGGIVGSRDLTGATVYLGAPGSRQRLRVYDKGLESGGEMDCIRWELESRKEAAETMAVALAYQNWGQVMASRLVGFVDFRDADSHSEVEERQRLPWFQLLVGLVKKASAYPPQVARTVEQVVEWLDKAIGPTLAVTMKFWRGDLGRLTDIIRRGEERLKPRHLAMLANAGAFAVSS